MAYRFLADGVLLLHLAFILFVMAGALLVAWRRRLMPLHLAAVAWGIGIEVLGAACPLTFAEVRLRLLAGGAGYHGGFIEHYLLPLIYPADLSRDVQYWLAGAVLVTNAALYFWILRRGRRKDCANKN